MSPWSSLRILSTPKRSKQENLPFLYLRWNAEKTSILMNYWRIRMRYSCIFLVPMNQRVFNKSSKGHNKTVNHMPGCMNHHEVISGSVITEREHCVSPWLHTYIYLYINILRSSCFCRISALCMLWVIFNQFYYAPFLTCWALFDLLVPALCNRTSRAQVHELRWGNLADW